MDAPIRLRRQGDSVNQPAGRRVGSTGNSIDPEKTGQLRFIECYKAAGPPSRNRLARIERTGVEIL
jgi:hypothetical protein